MYTCYINKDDAIKENFCLSLPLNTYITMTHVNSMNHRCWGLNSNWLYNNSIEIKIPLSSLIKIDMPIHTAKSLNLAKQL